MSTTVNLDDIYKEISLLRKDIKDIKKQLNDEDLTNFVRNLEKNNLLTTKKEAEKVGLKI